MRVQQSLTRVSISRKFREEITFSLWSCRIVFSFFFLFSIFKIFRQQFSFFSRSARFLKSSLFLHSIFKIVKTKVSFYSRFMRLCFCFSFSSCEKCFIFLERNMHFQGLRFGGKLLCNEVLGGYLMSEKENFSFSS